MEKSALQIIEAYDSEHIRAIRTLFRTYESSLNVDLCFQQFDEELAALPGDYAPPDGCLFLAQIGGANAGCVALRKIDDDGCEMKRLYVEPAFRGHGIGIGLIHKIIERGQSLNYQYMRLDTLPSMQKAIALYESLGFKDIGAYRHNPVAGVRYLELDLKTYSAA